MECVLCHHQSMYPVAVSERGDVYHLKALCSYLAQQLIEKKDEVNPELIDMSRIPVERIIQRVVPGRVTTYFPDDIEECPDGVLNRPPQVQDLAIRLMTAFTRSAERQNMHTLTKRDMILIRNDFLRGESPLEECWLKSLIDNFNGMSAGGLAVAAGTVALFVIVGKEIGRSLGLVQSKIDEDPPQTTVDPSIVDGLITGSIKV